MGGAAARFALEIYTFLCPERVFLKKCSYPERVCSSEGHLGVLDAGSLRILLLDWVKPRSAAPRRVSHDKYTLSYFKGAFS